MKYLKYVLLTFFSFFVIVVLVNCNSISEKSILSLPCIDDGFDIKYREDRMIQINFSPTSFGTNRYQIEQNVFYDIDSLKFFVDKAFKRIKPFYIHATSAFLNIDRNFYLEETEVLLMELRRLGFQTFIYATTKNCKKSNISDVGGLIEKKPILTKQNLDKYYKSRNWQIKNKENLLQTKIDSKIEVNTTSPPPRSLNENLYETFDENLEERLVDYKKIRIYIQTNGTYTFDNKDLTLNNLASKIETILSKNKCIFIIKSDKAALFQNYVELYSMIKRSIYNQRNDYSQKKYQKVYEELPLRTRRGIKEANDHIVIFQSLYQND